jgi:hypothetical protein
MDIVNQIVELLGQALEFAPFLAAVGIFSIAGQIAKTIFSKEKALKAGKYQWIWWRMRQTLPLHPVLAGFITGCIDKGHGISYYLFASVLSVFLFDLIQRLTGYKIDLPGDSLPPDA